MFFERSFLYFTLKNVGIAVLLASDRVLEWCGTQLQASVFLCGLKVINACCKVDRVAVSIFSCDEEFAQSQTLFFVFSSG